MQILNDLNRNRTNWRTKLFTQVSAIGIVLGAFYALACALAEMWLPVTPRWVFLEVGGGVILALTISFVVAQTRETSRPVWLSWQAYHWLVLVTFVAVGLPIVLWQVIKYF